MKLIAGNWKMNGLKASRQVLDELLEGLKGRPKLPEILLCPPATLIASFADRLQGTAVAVGGQGCHPKATGAHTGDISAEMLKDAGASYVIVGHSERRHVLGESDALVNRKTRAALAAGLNVILCIGETLEQRAEFAAELAALEPDEVPLNFLNPRPGTPFGDLEVMPATEALKAVAAFRLALPRTMLRFAGGREITLGDLGAKRGILGGINAVIVGNYLTTLGRPAEADLELLSDLQMPIKALNATL